jgi:hypothetical protein
MSSLELQQQQSLTQAKLFAEVARRTERPFDALPSGNVESVRLVLWQQATQCVLAAADDVELGAPAAPSASERAAGGPQLLEQIRQLLAPAANSSAEDAARADILAGFSCRLIAELEQPARIQRQERWLPRLYRLAAGLVIAGALAGGAYLALRPPDLVKHANRTLSSTFGTCEHGECGTALMHTQQEDHPWVMYDFGSSKRLHSIEVENRTDCCYERAVPLVVEASDDAKTWRELARTERPFMTWSSPLAAQARYVRLRVEAVTYLHLRRVVIR